MDSLELEYKFLLKTLFHMLSYQFRQTTSQDLEVLYTEYIQSRCILIPNTLYKQIHPVVHFLTVTIVQKQEKVSTYF